MQNQNEAFVSHMFCQQILRDHWHGNIKWKNKHNLFKFIYCFLQFTLTLPHIFHWLTRMMIIDFGITKEKWKLPKHSYDFLTGQCNLDQPLNRFISFTGIYMVYLLLVATCILTPLTDYDHANNNFHWYHYCLVVFTIGMVVSDFQVLTSSRSWSKVLSFWINYEIFLHLMLAIFAFSASYVSCLSNKRLV